MAMGARLPAATTSPTSAGRAPQNTATSFRFFPRTHGSPAAVRHAGQGWLSLVTSTQLN